MRLIITDRLIMEGRSGEYNACPIARALWECGFGDVNIDDKFIKTTRGKQKICLPTPRAMALFIDDFDNFRPVKPTEFELALHFSSDQHSNTKDHG